jgi:hypothetical protein
MAIQCKHFFGRIKQTRGDKRKEVIGKNMEKRKFKKKHSENNIFIKRVGTCKSLSWTRTYARPFKV